MAIEKQMEPSDLEIEDTDAEEIEVEIVNPDAVSIETDDGGVIIDFEGGISEELMGCLWAVPGSSGQLKR